MGAKACLVLVGAFCVLPSGAAAELPGADLRVVRPGQEPVTLRLGDEDVLAWTGVEPVVRLPPEEPVRVALFEKGRGPAGRWGDGTTLDKTLKRGNGAESRRAFIRAAGAGRDLTGGRLGALLRNKGLAAGAGGLVAGVTAAQLVAERILGRGAFAPLWAWDLEDGTTVSLIAKQPNHGGPVQYKLAYVAPANDWGERYFPRAFGLISEVRITKEKAFGYLNGDGAPPADPSERSDEVRLPSGSVWDATAEPPPPILVSPMPPPDELEWEEDEFGDFVLKDKKTGQTWGRAKRGAYLAWISQHPMGFVPPGHLVHDGKVVAPRYVFEGPDGNRYPVTVIDGKLRLHAWAGGSLPDEVIRAFGASMRGRADWLRSEGIQSASVAVAGASLLVWTDSVPTRDKAPGAHGLRPAGDEWPDVQLRRETDESGSVRGFTQYGSEEPVYRWSFHPNEGAPEYKLPKAVPGASDTAIRVAGGVYVFRLPEGVGRDDPFFVRLRNAANAGDQDAIEAAYTTLTAPPMMSSWEPLRAHLLSLPVDHGTRRAHAKMGFGRIQAVRPWFRAEPRGGRDGSLIYSGMGGELVIAPDGTLHRGPVGPGADVDYDALTPLLAPGSTESMIGQALAALDRPSLDVAARWRRLNRLRGQIPAMAGDDGHFGLMADGSHIAIGHDGLAILIDKDGALFQADLNRGTVVLEEGRYRVPDYDALTARGASSTNREGPGGQGVVRGPVRERKSVLDLQLQQIRAVTDPQRRVQELERLAQGVARLHGRDPVKLVDGGMRFSIYPLGGDSGIALLPGGELRAAQIDAEEATIWFAEGPERFPLEDFEPFPVEASSYGTGPAGPAALTVAKTLREQLEERSRGHRQMFKTLSDFQSWLLLVPQLQRWAGVGLLRPEQRDPTNGQLIYEVSGHTTEPTPPVLVLTSTGTVYLGRAPRNGSRAGFDIDLRTMTVINVP